MPRRRFASVASSLGWALLVACAGPPPPATPTSALTTNPTPVRSIATAQPTVALPLPSATPPGRESDDPTAVVVFADSSLGGGLSELASAFMVSNSAVTGVSYKFETSDKLRALIQQGADADVFASADARQMDTLRQANLLDGDDSVLVRTGLVIIVSKANPQGIQGLKDLANSGVRFIVPEPSSVTTARILATFDKASADATYGADFRSKAERNILARDGDGPLVVGRVATGEVTAGVVYGTDVDTQARARLQVIDIPNGLNTLVDYPIAVLKNGTNARGGHAFVTYALSAKAQDVLSKFGFIRTVP